MSGSFLEAISILEKIQEQHLNQSKAWGSNSQEFKEAWAKYIAVTNAIKELQDAHEHELNEMAKHFNQVPDDGLPIDVMPYESEREPTGPQGEPE